MLPDWRRVSTNLAATAPQRRAECARPGTLLLQKELPTAGKRPASGPVSHRRRERLIGRLPLT